MGFYFRKRVRLGKGQWLNLSKRGVSFSKRIGRFTFNSRGRANVRIGKGIGYRGGCLVAIALPLAAVSALATTIGLLVSRAV